MPNYERIARLLSGCKIRKPILKWNRSDCLTFLKSMAYFQKSSFFNIKSETCGYLKEVYGEAANQVLLIFESINYSDMEVEYDVEINYFFSHNELNKTIEKHIDIVSGHYNQITYLSTTIFMNLGWFGISSKDALQIRKSDVSQDGNVYVNGILYQFPAQLQELIIQLRDMQAYSVLDINGMQKTYTMKESEYLFRTTRTDVKTEESARVEIKELNTDETFACTEKKLAFEKIFASGVFYRALQDDLKNGAVYRMTGNERISVLNSDQAEKIFFNGEHVSRNRLVNTLRLYDTYKKIAMQTM